MKEWALLNDCSLKVKGPGKDVEISPGSYPSLIRLAPCSTNDDQKNEQYDNQREASAGTTAAVVGRLLVSAAATAAAKSSEAHI